MPSLPKPLNILLVEDEAYFRLFVAKLLHVSVSCNVAEAVNGVEALARCQEGDPDLILLDIYMPKMDGLQALPLIRRLKPATPIVMLTSVSEEAVVEECVELGASYFIRKDVPAGQLQEEMQKMLVIFFPVSPKPDEQPRPALAP